MVWAITQESIVPKTKMSLDLRKKITDVHKAGDVYTKLWQHFQGSRAEARSITKKFKESHIVKKKPGKGKKSGKNTMRCVYRPQKNCQDTSERLLKVGNCRILLQKRHF